MPLCIATGAVDHGHAGHQHPGEGLRRRRIDPHAHSHGHGGHGHHDGAHDHGGPIDMRANERRLLFVIVFGLVLLAAEVVAGFLANSLVLLSDAAHVSTDVAALGLAYAAIRISARPPTSSKSYGYYRAETVAAFVNALALWGISGYFLFEAWERLRSPPAVDGGIVAIVGGLSLAANILMAVILHRGSQESLNMRSAYAHVLSDALGSVAAVVAGLGILWYDARWLDPATTVIVAVLILVWTWRLTRDSLHILLEGTPATVKPGDVKDTIVGVPGVIGVHDLHVWSLTTGVDNLSAHVRVHDVTEGPAVVRAIREQLVARYGLSHITIEIEGDESTCIGCN